MQINLWFIYLYIYQQTYILKIFCEQTYIQLIDYLISNITLSLLLQLLYTTNCASLTLEN